VAFDRIQVLESRKPIVGSLDKEPGTVGEGPPRDERVFETEDGKCVRCRAGGQVGLGKDLEHIGVSGAGRSMIGQRIAARRWNEGERKPNSCDSTGILERGQLDEFSNCRLAGLDPGLTVSARLQADLEETRRPDLFEETAKAVPYERRPGSASLRLATTAATGSGIGADGTILDDSARLKLEFERLPAKRDC